MNYYNPYMFYPYSTLSTPTSTGLLGGTLGRGFSFSSLLNGAQKTLNFVNQAIPVVKQVSPMMKNAKTMFRVMNEFKKVDTPAKTNTKSTTKNPNTEPVVSMDKTKPVSDNGPTFFI